MGSPGEVLGELGEWLVDIVDDGVRSVTVVMPAPAGWGSTWVLDCFVESVISRDDLSVVVQVDGLAAGDTIPEQLTLLTESLDRGINRNRLVAKLAGTTADRASLGVSVADLVAAFFGAPAAGSAAALR